MFNAAQHRLINGIYVLFIKNRYHRVFNLVLHPPKPESGNAQSQAHATCSDGVNKTDFEAVNEIRLLGIDGSGEVYIGNIGMFNNNSGAVMFSSNPDFYSANAFQIAGSHVHQDWIFTEPGVYCLNMKSKAHSKTVETLTSAAKQQLPAGLEQIGNAGDTVWVVPPPPAATETELQTLGVFLK